MKTLGLKSFIKYLGKNKAYTIITLSGFAVSLMFVFLLSVYIKHELSVDQFHKKKDRIYRLVRDGGAAFAPPVGDRITNEHPEVEAYTRLFHNQGNMKLKNGEQVRINYLLADSAFFNIFSFNLLQGQPDYALSRKNSMVITQSFARKHFSQTNPIDEIVEINGFNFNITAIMDDLPENTHIDKCDVVINFNAIADLWGWQEILTTYGNSSFGLFFLEHENTNLAVKAPQILKSFKEDYWVFTSGHSDTLYFEPLSDVYFSDISGFYNIKQNNKTTLGVLAGIAILILIIAVINYINLTIAQAGFRAKETAIKKITGSSTNAVLFQHVSETVILTILSATVGVFLAFIAEPFFNDQMNTQLNLYQQFNIPFILFILSLVFLTGIISGLFPALLAGSYKPIDVVKGAFTRKTKNNYSKILIAFQYVVTIALLISTWIIVRQSAFMQNYDPGFQTENIFWMDNTIQPNQKAAFRDELLGIPGVEEVSYTRGTPMDGGNNQSFTYKNKPMSFQEFVVDSDFFSLLNINITPTKVAYSQDGVWLNKTAVKELELDDNIASFRYYDNEVPILGIVDDFNFRSLHTSIGPLMVGQLKDDYYPWSILVKVKGADLVATTKRIKKVQSNFTGGVPMESGYVDATINQWYNSEVKRSRLIGAFTLLAIIISSMGIFAMSLYYIQQKVKEIGIRKVNGARISEVLVMLNKDFVKWVAIAFVIATPIAWYAMNKWLQNFAYKTELSWWIFALAGLLALGIALLTVSWQSWRAARRNPVEALRYE